MKKSHLARIANINMDIVHKRC